MAEHLAPQNQYKDCEMRIPRYRYAKIPLNNLTSGTVIITPTATTLLEWKIPASSVVNMAKSFIAYQYQWPMLASNYGYIFEDGCDFRTAYFGNGSGLGIVDLQYADAAVNVLRPVRTHIADFLSKDELSEFYPCNQLVTSNIFPFSRDGLSTGVDNASTNNYLEPQHLNIAPVVNTPINVSRYFPLNSFKGTFLDCDKDVVFGTDMYLRLFTNYGQRLGQYTTTPTNPNANNTAITASVTMNNVYLYLAIEENLDIRNSLLTALSHGSIRMTIPYLYSYRFSVSGNAPSGNVSLTLTKNYGRGVKRITLVPFNAQEYSNYAFDHSNVNGTKISQIQSTMDGRPLTDYQLNVFNPNSSIQTASGQIWANAPINFADDYREALKVTAGSCLNAYPAYQSMWFYEDQWGVPQLTDDVGTEPIPDSFDLLHSGDHIYAISALTPGLQQATQNTYTSGLINYLFVEFIRTLVIQPDGIIMEP
jgi:hypothetical protein